MDFKTIMENWRRNVLSELDNSLLNEANRMAIIRKAQSHGGSSASPEHNPKPPYYPFIGHNYRTKVEIEDGTIELVEITDYGMMVWRIIPFDNKRKTKYGEYELAVQFTNWEPIVLSTASTKDKVLALLKNEQGETDDIKVHCTCPSFQFHYNDVANKQGVAIMPPTQAPGMGKTGRLANPGGAGVVCKHARRIIERFPNYYADIYSKILDIEKRVKGEQSDEN